MAPPIKLPDYVITAAAEGAVLDFTRPPFSELLAVGFKGPDTLAETATIEVNMKKGGGFGPLQSGAADIVITAGDVVMVYPIAFAELKVVLSGSATKTFEMGGRERI